ncbi:MULTISPECIES: carbohydrate ABC transporter permease [Clostridium]|nr:MULTISPECIES: carbohydrate ABC transporter permease [Clostridium]AQS06447.1 L-arabinose transport system permease protein AraQ [Clostridium beijerinckii]MBA2885824.1 raffinose/stachyose/melibiose transport system permease protein [Clostridium beijerinckii]MBA2900475.1 raffinose/stachyose/melibiose transport system permease protein [Clostridium beijerinckii]MBA2910383.1 raffinose/stachyose/melibiose transport system permease protein [Clostridium beijerinckii]MBA9013933.1 raffinose/stachyose/
MRIKKTLQNIFSNGIAWVITIISLIPLVLILFNALKTSKAASDMNLKLPTFPIPVENFSTVIERGKLATSFINSCVYSIGSVILCAILAAAASYVLCRNKTKLNRIIYMFIILGITMPINYVALMKVMSALHLMNSMLGIVLLYTAMQLPFSVFLLHGFIARIPVELDEAAVIDGCSPIRIFIYIIFPLLKPALATVVVLTFLNTWNEFVSPLYFLSSSSKWPMTLSVYNFFGMYFKDWNLVCSDIMLTSLPVIVVYLLGQKYIVSGMTAGAVKG